MGETDVSLNELLIACVKGKKPLWDMKDKGYSDRNLKSNLWLDISRELKIDEDFLKKEWKNLRDTFNKCLRDMKGKSGQGAVRKAEWPLMPHMLFLRDTLSPRQTTENHSMFDSSQPAQQGFYVITVPQLDAALSTVSQVDTILTYPLLENFNVEEVVAETGQSTEGDTDDSQSSQVSQTSHSVIGKIFPEKSPVLKGPYPFTSPLPHTISSPTPSPPYSRPAPPGPSSFTSASQATKEDPVDAAFHQFLLKKNATEKPKASDLASDEHFYLYIAKESQSLSKMRRMKLRHAVHEQLLKVMEEENSL